MKSTNKFKHILVILNEQLEVDNALAQAVKFAEKNSAQLTIFNTLYKTIDKPDEKVSDDLSLYVRDKQRIISERYNQLTQQDLSLNIIISWQVPPVKAIDNLINESNIDLIMKSPKPKLYFKDIFSTGLDHFLIRDCSVPIWLVKPRPWDDSIEVLACLDVDDESASNKTLNYQILETGIDIAALYEAELHLVDCYYGERASMSIDYDSKTGFRQIKSVKQEHQEKLTEYLKDFQSREYTMHIIEGIPDDSIPKKAKNLNAELTIIGNNKDSNIIDRTFGDTAKQLSDNMPCDILILKPVMND
jgi:universal stress protein E